MTLAVCVDLAGLDCRRFQTVTPGAGFSACGYCDAGRDDSQAGPDCLCCSTVDLAAAPPVASGLATGPLLTGLPATAPDDGDDVPPYRPPLS
jgi:hypothetical protein